MTEFSKPLRKITTPIPGLTIWDLTVHGDSRGWFKENWQRERMIAAGLPDFAPVQNNISLNTAVGTTRGIHAEPWDKFVSVATGRFFGAWVDMRQGPNFGAVYTAEVDPSRAVFVPRGVGNAFQTLEPNTAYCYLVNDHYSPDITYPSVNLADETVAIRWPIPLNSAQISQKDRSQPSIGSVSPIASRRTLVLGADGQLGAELRKTFGNQPQVHFASRTDFNLTDAGLAAAASWRDYDVIINAAAYTAVDKAETAQGRVSAWATNVGGIATLARIAAANNITLVHISSDYVFDGTARRPYLEDDPVCPLNVYGQTKAAGDQIVATLAKHYILRTSWVIGNGNNFVRTMQSLAERGVNPLVVNDQHGRLTFTSDIAKAIQHVLNEHAPYGTYNVTGSGPVMTWADIARATFALTGHDPDRVAGVSTEIFFSGQKGPVAVRPQYSVLDLSKIERTGFSTSASTDTLSSYLCG